MKRYLLFVILLDLPFLLDAQPFRGDSLLAHERSIDRPITLHRGQLRVTGGYGISFISRRYDAYGDLVNLSDDGIANSIRHRFRADVRYGLSELIQIQSAIAYSTNTVQKQTDYIIPPEPDPAVSHDVTTRYTGFEDLYVGIDLRAPFRTRKFDVALTLGLTLPVSPFEPPVPEHTFESADAGGSGQNKFSYHYQYPRGTGITVAQLGTMMKYRMPQFAFSGRVDYLHGLADGTSFEWRHQLNSDGTFDYRKDYFSYRLADSFQFLGEIEYQPLRRLDIFVDVSGHVAYRGWTSSVDDLKIATPYQASWLVSPGVEMLITPRLWLREKINFPVAGKNYEAPFSVEATLMYNLFPFQ